MNLLKLNCVVIGVCLCIVKASSRSITNRDVDDSTSDEPWCPWGQIFKKITYACENCDKYCRNGKNTSTCPQECRDFMDEIEMDQKSKEKQVEVTTPEEVTTPGHKQEKAQESKLGYLAAIIVLVVFIIAVCIVVSRRIKLRRRSKSVSDDIQTRIPLNPVLQNGPPNPGVPNPPVQKDPPNPTLQNVQPTPDISDTTLLQNGNLHPVVALSCRPSTTRANRIPQPTDQETGKRPKAFGPVSENTEMLDDARREQVHLVLSLA